MDKPKGGSRRYPRETIIKAIKKVRGGASMCSVAEEIGTRANSVKYWMDHADNYLGPEDKKALISVDGLDEKTRNTVCGEGWSAVIFQLKQSKKETDAALLRERTNFIDKVVPHLLRLEKAAGGSLAPEEKSPIPKADREKTLQEMEVIVARFTRNREEKESPSSQRGSRPEGEQAGPASGEVIDAAAEQSSSEGANEAASG